MEGSELVRVRSLSFWVMMKFLMVSTQKRVAVTVAAIGLALVSGGGVREGACQDEPYFKPHFEPTPTPPPPAPPPMFSFARFEDSFRDMCSEMEHDGRRVRFVSISEQQAESEKVCISCRSLWRSIVSACGKLGPKPTPKPKKTKTKTPPEDIPEGAEKPEDGSASGDESESPTPSPVPTKPPLERYPSTALIDSASRCSSEMYEADKENGAILLSLNNMIKVVRETKDLTSAEREYFDGIFSYLMAAWDGRVDPSTAPPPTPPADIEDFFEG